MSNAILTTIFATSTKIEVEPAIKWLKFHTHCGRNPKFSPILQAMHKNTANIISSHLHLPPAFPGADILGPSFQIDFLFKPPAQATQPHTFPLPPQS